MLELFDRLNCLVAVSCVNSDLRGFSMALPQLGDQLALRSVNVCSLPGNLVQSSAPGPAGQQASEV